MRDQTGYTVIVDEALVTPIKIDHDAGAIHIRPGHSPFRFGGFMNRAWVRLVWGRDWAPEFEAGPAPVRPALSTRIQGSPNCCPHCGLGAPSTLVPTADRGPLMREGSRAARHVVVDLAMARARHWGLAPGMA